MSFYFYIGHREASAHARACPTVIECESSAVFPLVSDWRFKSLLFLMGAWADVLEQSFLPQVKDSTPFSHLSFCELLWMSQYSYKKKKWNCITFFLQRLNILMCCNQMPSWSLRVLWFESNWYFIRAVGLQISIHFSFLSKTMTARHHLPFMFPDNQLLHFRRVKLHCLIWEDKLLLIWAVTC